MSIIGADGATELDEFAEDCAEDCPEGHRARAWVFTYCNYDEDDVAVVYSMGPHLGAEYVSCGCEVCPTTKTPHLQGVVMWPTVKSWTQMRSLLPGYWRVKVARSTFKKWSKYTQKEGDFYEFGVLPLDPKEKGEACKVYWQNQLDACAQGRYRDIHPQILATGLQRLEYGVERLRQIEAPPVEALPQVMNEWHWGVSGSGKSSLCHGQCDHQRSIDTHYWPRHRTDKIRNVFVDELTPAKVNKFLDKIKTWTADLSFPVERKNDDDITIRPQKFFFSSQANPATMIADQDWIAIRRRFKIYEWTQPYFLNADPELGRNPEWDCPVHFPEPPVPDWVDHGV